ncbi:MAG: bifunctional (p)ppGpp synthetase/guanosine-3',5'-bis(diphosphate) 3'-pyrophosphohydrolase [Synergistaceae bacterium]|nr:bifunctional (p)ppGpp synthetase/guanosine-3',5'-bis(diphosphate) 3'-pyrophosphohydrolase [Synergistaceae bacterium]
MQQQDTNQENQRFSQQYNPQYNIERGLSRDGYFEAIFPEDRTEAVKTAWCELWAKVYGEWAEAQLSELGNAFVFTAWAHSGQKRSSGKPFIIHSLSVAIILADMQLDVSTLIAALLHDVLEDTEVKKGEIISKFGEDVAALVDGVTKLNKLPYMSAEDYKAENLRKMFVVMVKDIRVVLIKLADRLHNMRTLGVFRHEKQVRIAQETLEIYAPLAHRLGIYEMKWELEDLAFKYSDPETYEDIRRKVRKRMPDREDIVQKGIEILSMHLEKAGIEFRIKGRAKHFFSIYGKMERKGLPVEQIYDLIAIRVLVKDVATCYAVLGIIHNTWVPVPGQFDDYIANPKSNMYQSLHTTIIGPTGEPLEIQIRTEEMNRFAEYGVAAHWRYKDGEEFSSKTIESKLDWIRQILEGDHEGETPSEFVEQLKTDFFAHEVCVFTPKGKPIAMPNESTMIDFAYAVHTEVGNHCVGATVDGRIVPLSTKVQHGNIIKITTSQQSSPSRDWLKIVHSNKTRNKIRAWFRQTEKLDKLEKQARGQEILDKELKRRELPLTSSEELSPHLNKVARDLGVNSGEDLIVAVGGSTVSASNVIQRLTQLWIQHHANEDSAAPVQKLSGKRNDFDVIVSGASGVQVTMSNCCEPVPGDQIIGYLTHLRGITIHRADCHSIRDAPMDKITQVEWNDLTGKLYTARLIIEALDRGNLLRDITEAIGISNSWIYNIKGSQIGNNIYRTKIEVSVRNLSHLLEIMGKLNNIKNVIEVVRG